MITRVELKGVRSSKDKGSIRFAPITVLAGTNSPGKSSIFQTVLATTKQTFEAPPHRAAGLFVNGKYISLDSYADWSSDHANGPAHPTSVLGDMPYNITADLTHGSTTAIAGLGLRL